MLLKRHYLVDLTAQGRQATYDFLPKEAKDDLVKALLFNEKIPGIMRRVETGLPLSGWVALGFSSPQRYQPQYNRLRVPVLAPRIAIKKVTTPYQVLQKPFQARTPCLQALREISELARRWQIELGVWGSAGLEIYTGLSYTDGASDLDLLIKSRSFAVLQKFYLALQEISQKYNCLVDTELDLPNGYGVKLAELFMHTTTILGKSMKGVKLFPQNIILEML